MTKEQLLEQLQNAQHLDGATKQQWLDRIAKEGLTEEVIIELSSALQEQLETTFEELGVYEVDPNNAEDKKSYDAMIDKIHAAKDSFDARMASLQQSMQQVVEETAQGIDKAYAQDLSSTIKGS